MSYIITNNKHYKNIASAIRSKLRVDTKYTPEEMAGAIGNIPSSADGTDIPVAGIYFTDPDENGNATVAKLVELNSTYMPNVFTMGLIHKTLKQVEFVNCYFTQIARGSFSYCSSLEKISIPEGIVTIGPDGFFSCNNLKSIELADSMRTIDAGAFQGCDNLTSINFLNMVTLGDRAFLYCSHLTNVIFPNTLKEIARTAFDACVQLTDVTLGDDFDCNNLSLAASTKYTRETIVSWFNALKDRTGESLSYKLTIGNQNLKKLTSEDIAIANNKNWTIV